MVAIGLVPEEGEERVVEVHLDVPVLHLPPELGARVARAEGVREDADDDAAPRGRREGVHEVASGGVVLEDVRLEEHLAFGGGDRGAHRGERGRALEEDRHVVAPVDRRRVDAPEEDLEFRDPRRRSGSGLGEAADARRAKRARQHPERHRAQDRPEKPRRSPPGLRLRTVVRTPIVSLR